MGDYGDWIVLIIVVGGLCFFFGFMAGTVA